MRRELPNWFPFTLAAAVAGAVAYALLWEFWILAAYTPPYGHGTWPPGSRRLDFLNLAWAAVLVLTALLPALQAREVGGGRRPACSLRSGRSAEPWSSRAWRSDYGGPTSTAGASSKRWSRPAASRPCACCRGRWTLLTAIGRYPTPSSSRGWRWPRSQSGPSASQRDGR